MDRRQFVAGASVGVAAAASAFPKPAIAQGVRELKMVTIWPKPLPGLQRAPNVSRIDHRAFGRAAANQGVCSRPTGRRHRVDDAVASGLADLYHGSEVTWAGKSPDFAYFCNVPFGFTAGELNAWIYYGGGQALWDELAPVSPQGIPVRRYRPADGQLVHQGADQHRIATRVFAIACPALVARCCAGSAPSWSPCRAAR